MIAGLTFDTDSSYPKKKHNKKKGKARGETQPCRQQTTSCFFDSLTATAFDLDTNTTAAEPRNALSSYLVSKLSWQVIFFFSLIDSPWSWHGITDGEVGDETHLKNKYLAERKGNDGEIRFFSSPYIPPQRFTITWLESAVCWCRTLIPSRSILPACEDADGQ